MNSGQQKKKKEKRIIEAAEKIFFSKGYVHSKMEEIANEAGFSKVTLYSYFGTKENLYMAVTFKALQYLTDLFYSTVDKYKIEPGLEGFMALADIYFDFCIKSRDYSQLLLDYSTIANFAISGKELDSTRLAMQQSIYYRKIRDIQNLPIQIAVQEIERGQEDGSIIPELNPWLVNHLLWSMAIGYSQVNRRPDDSTFLKTDIQTWKDTYIQILKNICIGSIDIRSINNTK